jgi:hypothetical protein
MRKNLPTFGKNELVAIAVATTFIIIQAVAMTTTVQAQATTDMSPPSGASPLTIPLQTNATNPVTGAPLTPATQQIIIDIQTECQEQGVIIAEDCVSVWHESPTTLVLNGGTLLLAAPGSGPIGSTGNAEDLFGENFGSSVGNYPNIHLWQAVDAFKAQGYTVTSVLLGGQGSQGNPHEFFVIMSK